MDIQKWLNETAGAETSLVSAQTSNSNFFHASEKPRPVFRQQRVPKVTKSDSSVLVPHPQSLKAPLENPKHSINRSSDVGTCSEESRPSCNASTESKSSSQRYARKPRRKTRLERYEPKQHKELGKYVHQGRKSESKRSRRKSTRKKGDKSNSGKARIFHAQNVSRDRLTLKPKDQLGIFNKGRASTAVRGRGLPDLVFSEMRFLQKGKDQSEPVPQQDTTKKKRKRNHEHTKEGEISAFFTATRPALLEWDKNIRPNDVRANNDKTDMIGHCERERSQKSSAVVPTIEIPGTGPCLEVESRGPRHGSTSYVSWSESVRAPDLSPKFQKPVPVVEENQDESSKHRTRRIASAEENSGFKRPAPLLERSQRRDASVERFRISSLAPSQHRIARSHSYPPHTFSLQKVDLTEGALNGRLTGSVASPSSLPPFVSARTRVKSQSPEPSVSSRLTQHQEASLSATEHNSNFQQVEITDQSDTDARQQTSSDLGKVIQQCNYMFQEHRRAAKPHVHYVPTTSIAVDETESYAHPLDPYKAHRRPAVHFSYMELPSPRLPNFSGPSIYEQQAHRQRAPSQIEHDDDLLFEGSYLTEQELVEEQDDVLYNDGNWEDQCEESVSYSSGMTGGRYGKEDSHASLNMVQRLASDNSVVAPGFWRPNKLY